MTPTDRDVPLSRLCEILHCNPDESVGFDTEFSGPRLVGGGKNDLNMTRVSLVGLSVAIGKSSWYVPVGHSFGRNAPLPGVIALLKLIFGRRGPTWAHHWKVDLHAARSLLSDVDMPAGARDSMLLAWLCGEKALGLKALAAIPGGPPRASFAEVAKGRSAADIPPQEIAPYAAEDAADTLRLGKALEVKIDAALLAPFLAVEMPLVRVLADVERRGMAVDAKGLGSLAGDLDARLAVLLASWEELLPGVNIRSAQQIRVALFDSGAWPTEGVPETPGGQLCTDRATVGRLGRKCAEGSLGRRCAEIRMEYQFLSKFRSTYTSTLVVAAEQHADGRLHPQFNQHSVATGRLSCSRPNLQNIPARDDEGIAARIRRCFVAPEGRRLVSADYSQIELRVLAHLAGDGRMRTAYAAGIDLHAQTAELVGCSRNLGKVGNFAAVYGAGPGRISELFGCSRAEASRFLAGYRSAYPEVGILRGRVLAAARRRGWLRTLNGRRRYFSGWGGADDWKLERAAFNTPIQAGAADIMKLAMLRAHAKGLPIVSQVHDEVLLEVPAAEAAEAAEELRECMEGAFSLAVPLVAEPRVGQNWAECK